MEDGYQRCINSDGSTSSERNYALTNDVSLVDLISKDINNRSYTQPVFRYVIDISKPNVP